MVNKNWCLLLVVILIGLVSAQNIAIDGLANNYLPGEEIKVKLTLYDDDLNKIDGQINFSVKNYYSEIVKQGDVNSGEEFIFKLPENAWNGYWAIFANYGGIEKEEKFKVGELAKIDIKLEGDNLIITNVGNVACQKKISIEIGEHDETALVNLEFGQKKNYKINCSYWGV